MKPRPHRRGFFVDAVIFDLGGVLVDWNPRHLYRALFDDEAAMEDFLATVCTPAWHNRLDGGESFAAAIAALSRDFPERRALIEAYDSGWPRMFKGPITGTVAVLERLAAAGLPTRLQDIAGFRQEGLADADALMTLMAQDKKVRRGRLTFILLKAIGQAVVSSDVEPSMVRDFLARKLADAPA